MIMIKITVAHFESSQFARLVPCRVQVKTNGVARFVPEVWNGVYMQLDGSFRQTTAANHCKHCIQIAP